MRRGSSPGIASASHFYALHSCPARSISSAFPGRTGGATPCRRRRHMCTCLRMRRSGWATLTPTIDISRSGLRELHAACSVRENTSEIAFWINRKDTATSGSTLVARGDRYRRKLMMLDPIAPANPSELSTHRDSDDLHFLANNSLTISITP